MALRCSSSSCEEWTPAFVMLVVDVGLGIMNAMVKNAIAQGMNHLILLTLRQLTATAFMAPIAYFVERKSRPKLTAWIFLQLFFSALLGATLTQYFFFLGLQYISATSACAFINMAPVFTFLMALPFRLERLDVKKKAGKAKVMGTLVSLGGAMLLTFYKGPALTHLSHSSQTQPANSSRPVAGGSNGAEKWMVGSTALLAASLCWSSWFLVQSKIVKNYPVIYSSTALMFFLSFLQAAALGFATQRGFSLWALRGKVETITVLYSGVVGSGLGFLLMSWCVKKRGPLFTAAFSPPIQIVVAIIEFSVLHEQLHLGSVLGSILVICGLYLLLWGKSRETLDCEVKQVQASEEGQAPTEPV